MRKQWLTLFWGAQNSLQIVTATMKLKNAYSLEGKLDSILKSRDFILPAKVFLVKAMVFPVVMYGCESWTIKKAERWRIDAFQLWCWRRLLRVPWTTRRSNQSILKEISPGVHWKDWCWNWDFNTLATWCKELTHLKRPWCWERLKAGEGGDRGWDGWMASPTQCTWVWVNSGVWWWTGRPGVLWFMGSQRVRHDCATELNWTEFSCESTEWFFLHILAEFSPEAAFSRWPSWRVGLLHPWSFLLGFFGALWSQNQEGKDTGCKDIWGLGSETCTISLCQQVN